MRRRRRGDAGSGGLGAAGWLFAELALLLMVVVVGSEVTDAQIAGPDGTSTEPTPASPTTPPPAEGLALRTETFLMPATADGEAVARFAALLTERIGPDTKVGLVLLFGVSRTGALGDGAAVSGHLRSLLLPAGIPQLRSAVDIRAYIGSANDGARGDVLVELFLLNGPS